VRINVGGPSYTTSLGRVFSADTSFTGGTQYVVTNSISGTTDPSLYQNERWGQFSYSIPVANGTYDVRLHFAELYYGNAAPGPCVGKRIFGMDVLDTAGTDIPPTMDICAEVGPLTALVKIIRGVQITDGAVDVRSVYGSIDDPELTALEVVPATTGPPTVSSTSPTAGATGVGTGSPVTATFSRAMDGTTITGSTFTLTGPGGAVPATVTYNSSTNTATLTPTANLATSTSYTATVTTGAKATDGQALAAPFSWSFTTAAAPTVTANTPANGATGVATTTTATATFSRAMDATTITNSTFTLTPSGGPAVAATVSYNATTRVATLTPTAALAGNTTYTARLANTIKAADTTPLAAAVTWSFTTAAPTPPTVTANTPANGATGVATSVAPTATFSRAMDATTITNTSFTLTPSGGSAVAATVAYNSGTLTATLTPSAALASSTTYTARLETTIKAADGVALASAVTWSFTTAAPAPPTVTANTPANGATGVATTVAPTATFSRAMDATTITNTSFTLTPSGGSAVGASVAYNATTRVATLTPSAALANSTTYTARLETTIKAADGVALASAFTWSFTTAAAPDTTPPTVSITAPTGGVVSANVDVTANATDDRGVVGVQFKLDGANLGAEDTTAPYSFTWDTRTVANGNHTLTAVARDTVNSTTSAGVVVDVENTGPPPGTTTTRINAGGAAFTTGGGLAFQADALFTGGKTFASSDAIAGTTDDALYQNERWGQFSYAIPVTNGAYDVRLHFVELFYNPNNCVGKRVFGMDIVDTAGQDLSNIDICAQVGADTALVTTISGVNVTDGTLNIQSVYGAADDPEIAAIEVVPAAGGGGPPPPPTPPTVTSMSPPNGSTGVATGAAVSAVFSRAMDPATITTTSFTLAPTAGPAVAATVAYNNATLTATLTPSAALTAGATYTARLDTTVKASDGTALASPVTWSFTTSTGGTPGTTISRINSGGGAFTAGSGVIFQPDTQFTGGTPWTSTAAIANTTDDGLYQNERWGQFSYAIPVTNGTYDVTFHFVELFYAAPCSGARIFGMDILDTPGIDVPNTLDICAQVGPNAALARTVRGVSVTDGTLNVQSVYGSIDDPELAGIEVVPAS
jgi:hypothetical protein